MVTGPFNWGPGKQSVTFTGIVLGNLSLSTSAFSALATPGSVLATISGQTAGSRLALNDPDARGYFALDFLQQNLIAGPNWPAPVGYRVRIDEVMQGAINSPMRNVFQYGASGSVSPPIPSDILPTLSAAAYQADYDAMASDASRMTLVQGSYNGRSSTFTAAFPLNRVSTFKNKLGAGLPDLTVIAPGSQTTNGPIYQNNYLNDIGAFECRENERGIGAAAGTLPLSATSVKTILQVYLPRDCVRKLNTQTPTFLARLSIGTKFIAGIGGASPPAGAVTGQSGFYANGSTGTWNPLSSGSQVGQMCVEAYRIIGASAAAIGTQAPGTIRPFLNSASPAISDVAFVPDADGRVMIGTINGATNLSVNCFDGPIFRTIIIDGPVTDAEIASLITWANQRVYGKMGATFGIRPRMLKGQSNGATILGAAASATLAQDYGQARGDALYRQLWGLPTAADYSTFFSVSVTALAAKPIVESNNAWANSTTLNTALAGSIDDINGAASATDPTTWPAITVSGTAVGPRIHPPVSGFAHASSLYSVLELHSENDGNSLGSTTGFNRHVVGNIYAGISMPQALAHFMAGKARELDLLRAESGNPNLKMGVGLLGFNQTGNGFDLVKIAQIQIVRNNPTKFFLLGENPGYYFQSDLTSTIHWQFAAYDLFCRLGARAEAYDQKLNGFTPTGALQSGPSYGKSPRITGISAVAGNSYIDLTVSKMAGTSLTIPTVYTTTGDSNVLANLATTGDVAVGTFTIQNVADLTSVHIGNQIIATGVPTGSRVAAISGTTVTFSNVTNTAATGGTTGQAVTFVRLDTLINVPTAAFTNMQIGMQIRGGPLRQNSYIVAFDAASGVVTFSPGPTAAVTGISLQFGNAWRFLEVWRANQAYGQGFTGCTHQTATDNGQTVDYYTSGFEISNAAAGDIVGTPTVISDSGASAVIRIPTANPNVSGVSGWFFYGRENTNLGLPNCFMDTIQDTSGTDAPAEPYVEAFGRFNLPLAIEPQGIPFTPA